MRKRERELSRFFIYQIYESMVAAADSRAG